MIQCLPGCACANQMKHGRRCAERMEDFCSGAAASDSCGTLFTSGNTLWRILLRSRRSSSRTQERRALRQDAVHVSLLRLPRLVFVGGYFTRGKAKTQSRSDKSSLWKRSCHAIEQEAANKHARTDTHLRHAGPISNDPSREGRNEVYISLHDAVYDCSGPVLGWVWNPSSLS